MTDLTRLNKNNEKKSISIASATIKAGDVAGTDAHILFNLPANAVITDAMIVVEVAGQTNLTADLGFDGGNELGNDIDIDDIGVKSPTLVTSVTVTGEAQTVAGTATKAPRIVTGTGKSVTIDFSAAPTAGIFHIIVEFVEYTLGNGNLMNHN